MHAEELWETEDIQEKLAHHRFEMIPNKHSLSEYNIELQNDEGWSFLFVFSLFSPLARVQLDLASKWSERIPVVYAQDSIPFKYIKELDAYSPVHNAVPNIHELETRKKSGLFLVSPSGRVVAVRQVPLTSRDPFWIELYPYLGL